MKTSSSSPRFVAMCVPGRDDLAPAAWFVFDRESKKTVRRCVDRKHAVRAAAEIGGAA